jgi:uncharacterized protein (UPF0548 family)
MKTWRDPAAQAIVGGGLWAAWALSVQPSWTSCLLMLSPLVLVPLGLGLANRPDAGPAAALLDRLRLATTPAAVVAALAFVLDPGALAAVMTLPWLGVGLVAGAVGVGRFLSRRRLEPSIGVDAGLAFLTVGAAWLTISRLGANPLGFNDAIVQLTAVHFHYAGFALPLVAGLVAQRAGRGLLTPGWVVIGVPLTAAGITAGGTFEWVAATVMAMGGLATAGLLAHTAVGSRGVARTLLLLAALSLTVGMVLALGWAWSVQFGWTYLDLELMARWHGTLNAIGFGFAALVGLHRIAPGPAPGEQMAVHIGRPDATALSDLATRFRETEPTSPIGLLGRPTPSGYRRDTWDRELPHGFEPARTAVQRWAGHRNAGITITDPPPIVEGETVSLAIPVGPLSVTATARIVDVVDEPDRYGFTYATLPHHPSDGEESFIVSRCADGTTMFTVTAVWRGATLAARVLPPLTRFLQRRAIGRYLEGIAGGTFVADREAVA